MFKLCCDPLLQRKINMNPIYEPVFNDVAHIYDCEYTNNKRNIWT